MPMTVKLTIPKIDVVPPESVLREVGDLAIRLIRTRTEKGQSSDGGPFRPLSEDYAKAKRAELGHDRADLMVSGRMLNDMAVTRTTRTAVTIGFRSQGGTAPRGSQTLIQRSRAVGAQDKAFWHHVAGAGRSRVRRPFFSLTHPDVAQIRQAVDRWLTRMAQSVTRGGA